jgi:hypothetical protein
VQRSAVQVVLGEGEPGVLRLVLEAQGFAVVGYARGDEELERVLEITDPSVIVLDAGISAQAALDARETCHGAPIVVVWPRGVAAVVAEEHVDPATVFQDLGAAVRRAASRNANDEDVIRVPDADERVVSTAIANPPSRVAEPAPSSTPARPRRARRALVAAMAWALSLITLATIAIAVPRALDVLQDRDRAPRPSVQEERRTPSLERPDGRGEQGPTEEDGAPACDPRQERVQGPPADRGRPDEPGRGCRPDRGKAGQKPGQGRGRPEEPGQGRGRPEEPGQGRGRPDDPGGGRAEGKGSGRQDGEKPGGKGLGNGSGNNAAGGGNGAAGGTPRNEAADGAGDAGGNGRGHNA